MSFSFSIYQKCSVANLQHTILDMKKNNNYKKYFKCIAFHYYLEKKKFPSLIKHSPWAYSTPTLLIFPHNNSMLSLTLLFSFVYTRCWQSTPPSKLSSAIPYHKISLQAYKEIVFTFFFLITTKADRQGVAYVSTFFWTTTEIQLPSKKCKNFKFHF